MAGQGLEMPVKAFRGVQGRFRPGKAQGKPGVDMVQGGASEQIGRVFERCRELFQVVDIIHIGAVQIVVLQLQDQDGREQTAAGHRRVGRGNGVEPSEPMGQSHGRVAFQRGKGFSQLRGGDCGGKAEGRGSFPSPGLCGGGKQGVDLRQQRFLGNGRGGAEHHIGHIGKGQDHGVDGGENVLTAVKKFQVHVGRPVKGAEAGEAAERGGGAPGTGQQGGGHQGGEFAAFLASGALLVGALPF